MKKRILFLLLSIQSLSVLCAEAGVGASPAIDHPVAATAAPMPAIPQLVASAAGPGAGAGQGKAINPLVAAGTPIAPSPAPGRVAAAFVPPAIPITSAHGAGAGASLEANHHSLIPSPKNTHDGILSSLFDLMGYGAKKIKKDLIDPHRSKRVVILSAIRQNTFFSDYPAATDQQKAIVDVFSDVAEKAKNQESRIQQLLSIINFAQQTSLPIAPSVYGEVIPHVAAELSRCSQLLQLLQSSQKPSDCPADG